MAFMFWNQQVNPGKPQPISSAEFDDVDAEDGMPPALLHITQACFTDNVKPNSRTVVNCKTGESDGPLCVLTAGKQENQHLDIIMPMNEGAQLYVSGANPSVISLSGYIQPMDMYPESYDDDSELGEMDEAEAARYLKHKRQFDAMESESETQDSVEPQKKKSRKQIANGDEQKEDSVASAASTKKSPKQSPKASPKDSPKDKASKKGKGKFVELKGGLKYKDIREGNGPAAKKGNKVSVFYVGQLEDGSIFDKLIDGEPLEFNLGGGEVIKGWELGIAGMKVGGKRRLVVPPKFGYGAQGQEPEIPPNAKLTFTVEVKSID